MIKELHYFGVASFKLTPFRIEYQKGGDKEFGISEKDWIKPIIQIR